MDMKNRFPPLPKTISIFSEQEKPEGSTMQYGHYYHALMKLPFFRRKRSVRVWLPHEYVTMPKRRFPVIYMSDGQNLVDAAFSAYGDWHLDRVLHALKKEEGLLPPILVGIDCPKHPGKRANELCPPYPVLEETQIRGYPNHPIANQYIDFIVDELKPLIDANFRTDPSPKATGLGGSSMGGIMAFYGYFYRKEVFGFSLAFSIPFFFYKKSTWAKIIQGLDPDLEKCGKMAMFVGGEGYESGFVPGAREEIEYLRSLGFGEDKILFMEDETRPHHEEAWADYSYPAFKFWLEGLPQ